MKKKPAGPRRPLKTLSEIQPAIRVPGIPAISYQKYDQPDEDKVICCTSVR